MRNVGTPIFVRLGNRARPFKEGMATPAMGRMRSVTISNVQADGASRIGCSITGLPEYPAQDIALENVRIQSVGGGSEEDAQRPVPEHAEKYPENSSASPAPAMRRSRVRKNIEERTSFWISVTICCSTLPLLHLGHLTRDFSLCDIGMISLNFFPQALHLNLYIGVLPRKQVLLVRNICHP
jgi:hypothetical protein